MKPSTAILYVLVTLSLIFSITALFIVITSHDTHFSSPNSPTPSNTTPPITNTPPPTPAYTSPPITNTPPPTPAPYTADLTLNYNYTLANRVDEEHITKITLTVNVTYNGGDTTTIDYSRFYLQLTVSRSLFEMTKGTTAPQNSGSFTLGPLHPSQTIQLDFVFPRYTDNNMDGLRSTGYYLCYNKTAPA